MANSFIPKNILISGGAGFIGSHFVAHALKAWPNTHLITLDKLTYAGNLENLKSIPNTRHTFVKGDICDQSLALELLRKHDINCIAHFAAESHVDRSISGPAEFIQTNIVGTFSLLEAAKQYWLNEKNLTHNQCRFHHISTDEVYGTLEKSDPAFSETTPYAPNSPYSASKASSDHLVRAYFHTYGLPITMSNCSNNYGPHQHPEKLIPTIINACRNQQPIPIYGDGSNIRDWLYVGDHVDAILKIIQQGTLGETYNVGGNCERNNLEITKQICQLMDQRHPEHEPHANLITFVKDRAGHDWRYAIDACKIADELAWQPATEFSEGLARTIEFYGR